MLLLCISSIFIGYLFHVLALNNGFFFWNNSLFILLDNSVYSSFHFISFIIKNLPLLIILLGILFMYIYIIYFKLIYYFLLKYNKLIFLYRFFFKTLFIDLIYIDFFFYPLINVSYYFYFKNIEKGFFEYFGPYGLLKFFYYLNYYFKKIMTGYIFDASVIMGYMICLFISFFIIICFSFLTNYFYLEWSLIMIIFIFINLIFFFSKDLNFF
jgi:hypothetical protein